MAERLEVHLPDIGDFHDVDVVELLVSVGQRVEKEQSLLVLESDKATMEIPRPRRAWSRSCASRVGDQVNEGDLIAVIRAEGAAPAAQPAARKPRPPRLRPHPRPRPRAAGEARPRRREPERRRADEPAPAARARRSRTPRRRCAGSRASSAWTSRACRAPRARAASRARTCRSS